MKTYKLGRYLFLPPLYFLIFFCLSYSFIPMHPYSVKLAWGRSQLKEQILSLLSLPFFLYVHLYFSLSLLFSFSYSFHTYAFGSSKIETRRTLTVERTLRIHKFLATPVSLSLFPLFLFLFLSLSISLSLSLYFFFYYSFHTYAVRSSKIIAWRTVTVKRTLCVHTHSWPRTRVQRWRNALVNV